MKWVGILTAGSLFVAIIVQGVRWRLHGERPCEQCGETTDARLCQGCASGASIYTPLRGQEDWR